MTVEMFKGDHGLGLCTACMEDYIAARAEADAASVNGGTPKAMPQVQWAITWAPALRPVPGPLRWAVVALPSCYGHLVSVPAQPDEPGLILPRR
jgi:hypothetical protein